MKVTPAVCGSCRSALRKHSFNTDAPSACPKCYTRGFAYAYPAWGRSKRREVQLESADLGSATCFFHESRKAAQICEGCGKFLCPVCSIEYAAGMYCPDCISSGKVEGIDLKSSSRRFDRFAFMLSLVPLTLVLWFTVFLTAPACLFLVIRHWSDERPVLSFNRWRFVVAGILATLQIVGIAVFIYAIVSQSGS